MPKTVQEQMPKKLILKNSFSPGDIIMLTAAVRDLHSCYPGQFQTDVRTRCPGLWENNPHLTPLREADPEVQLLECSYPLINTADVKPYHCLHGFIHFLNEQLGLSIQPTVFKGDIHLSDLEKSWYSQVYEAAGRDMPFWIVAAGGKYDITIKWWESVRYQQAIDYFQGKIAFVQVGEIGHHHPKLRGVIDLRGKTTLRELIRLVYHSQGVLCSVTALMHLAAAVETKYSPLRPCVVVAGGREPVHWEAYPGHQFIHTIGSLACCATTGCWRDRALPLKDGDPRDQANYLCTNLAGQIPRCMDLIPAGEVIRRIELSFAGGMLSYLSPSEVKGAKRAIHTTAANDYDNQPLTIHNSRAALDSFLEKIPPYPGGHSGRGIVICAGGPRYFTNAWVCIRMLRHLGCHLPVEVWHLGRPEFDGKMERLLEPLEVKCVDASKVRKQRPARKLGGWELKPYAILNTRFREILYLDADNLPVVNPEYLFDILEFKRTGAVFWPDFGRLEKGDKIWENCGLKRPPGPEFETGQIIVDKARCWRALALALWFNEHSDFYYQNLHGDKETFHLAFEKLNQAYALVPWPIHALRGTMCQHDFHGRRLFQHRNTDKWNLLLTNRKVRGFRHETLCRDFIRQLRGKWDGCAGRFRAKRPKRRCVRSLSPSLEAVMISCGTREAMRRRTLRRLAQTDWGAEPVFVQVDREEFDCPQERQAQTSFLALQHFLRGVKEYLLFLEDDLAFNRYVRHNLMHWPLLRDRQITLAGLYNPGLRESASDVLNRAWIVDADAIFGSQAFLISRPAAQFMARHWSEVAGMQDIKISRLAGRLRHPIYYHAPSLVQHLGAHSVWGGLFHQSHDFDPHWKA